MSVQVQQDNNTEPFVLGGVSYSKDGQTILTDAGRTDPLLFGTVLAKVAASQKWVPLTSLTETTGESVAQGIYMGDTIAAATIAAGDVTNVGPILVGGGCAVDTDQIVLENSLTLDSVFSASDATNVYEVITVRDQLARRGIFAEATVSIDEFEA